MPALEFDAAKFAIAWPEKPSDEDARIYGENYEYMRERARRFFRFVKCTCGEPVYVPEFTNTCEECERDYNSSGHLLAPRSWWGEETGESADDILRHQAMGYPEIED